MTDREKVLQGLECCANGNSCSEKCPYDKFGDSLDDCVPQLARDALILLKEQDHVWQKMWNALYAEEDRLEKRFVGTDEHDNWFMVYRPWLQNGFEIAIKVLSELFTPEPPKENE